MADEVVWTTLFVPSELEGDELWQHNGEAVSRREADEKVAELKRKPKRDLMMVRQVSRRIAALQLPGRYEYLKRDLEQLSPEALRELDNLLRHVEQEIETAKHRYRPFPGGPLLRM